ncbi:hypothetical protein JOB18_001661 [Solea senegalensis]|uniref:Uncharacterized protein n=1 Tax=Solea senegalensis TaxID=28829 RepID=A0AAV6PS81_SOLSE|nr:hypothetical protein JOB18_001661 [Solea senegalensis]
MLAMPRVVMFHEPHVELIDNNGNNQVEVENLWKAARRPEQMDGGIVTQQQELVLLFSTASTLMRQKCLDDQKILIISVSQRISDLTPELCSTKTGEDICMMEIYEL